MKAGITSSIDAGEAIVGAPPPNRPSDCIAMMLTTPPATNVVVLGFIMANAAAEARAVFRASPSSGLLCTSEAVTGYNPPRRLLIYLPLTVAFVDHCERSISILLW